MVEAQRPYNLSEFMSIIIPEEKNNNYNVLMQSEVSDKIHEVVQSEAVTMPTVATIFWEILSETEFYAFFLTQIPQLKIKNIKDIMVVSHGQDEFSLLIFVENISKDQHFLTSANNCPLSEIRDGFRKWSAMNEEALNNMEFYIAENFLHDQERIANFRNWSIILRSVSSPDFMFSILSKMKMNIIVNRAPEIIMTNSNWTVDPFHTVAPTPGSKPNSTAGIYTENHNGIFGVTVCRHALGDEVKLNQIVEVNGQPCRVVSMDLLSDSCFVEIMDNDRSNLISCNGPLQVIPKSSEKASFMGLKSGKQQATVVSWDRDILLPFPQLQRRIYTDAVTNPGDSGAVLLNENDQALGFSFYRTAINAQPEYSAWIWAESVFQIHNLKF